MRIELKGFQEEAGRKLLKHVTYARKEARDGDAQAIVLSSPTGSGKTVTITALMEWIYQGDENTGGDPEAIFLWLSDSPELNRQSREKILNQSSVFKESSLVLVEPPFSQECFEAGKVYFLNTQKLGKESLLTRTGDGPFGRPFKTRRLIDLHTCTPSLMRRTGAWLRGREIGSKPRLSFNDSSRATLKGACSR